MGTTNLKAKRTVIVSLNINSCLTDEVIKALDATELMPNVWATAKSVEATKNVVFGYGYNMYELLVCKADKQNWDFLAENYSNNL